jgi:uncharacterized membrane protein YeaQ/YmgE (transglycosylase-associated protein family)
LKILIVVKRRSNPPPADYQEYGIQNQSSNSEENYMGIISWIVIGAFAGLVARRIVPGPDPGRFIVTVILGIAGASLGGFTMGVLGGSGTTSFDVWTVLVATLGAVLSLYLYSLIVRRTA